MVIYGLPVASKLKVEIARVTSSETSPCRRVTVTRALPSPSLTSGRKGCMPKDAPV